MDFIGRNAIKNLHQVIGNQTLLFSTRNILKNFKDTLDNELKDREVDFYLDITPNPQDTEIHHAIKKTKDKTFDTLIAFGGGSVIDFAKAYKFYKKISVPLIAIPTTAGTGSEATQFAVVYVDGHKTSLDNESIRPNISIIDSQFVENAPQKLKATTAMDAYCQAIESFWAKKATFKSRKYALNAIELCRDYLVEAVNTNHKEANEKMALAAHLSGLAINISRTTAAHALSYKITTQYGIPHGHAVALSIAKLFKLNLGHFANQEILLNNIKITKNEIFPYFHNLMQEIGLEDSLEKLGISNKNDIISSVNQERLSNNPKVLDNQDLNYLLSEINL